MEERAEAERAANPAQTTALFGVKKGFPDRVVDAGNPLQFGIQDSNRMAPWCVLKAAQSQPVEVRSG